jgi:hypothetical protein
VLGGLEHAVAVEGEHVERAWGWIFGGPV